MAGEYGVNVEHEGFKDHPCCGQKARSMGLITVNSKRCALTSTPLRVLIALNEDVSGFLYR
jgi:hypothetical protein